MERTRPYGRVVGIDLIPAQPPRGVATFQGDFLSPSVQKLVKDYIVESHRRQPPPPEAESPEDEASAEDAADIDRPSYIDIERQTTPSQQAPPAQAEDPTTLRLVDVRQKPPREIRLATGDTVLTPRQIVLSDMSEPWDQTSGFNVNSLSNPYRRLMNTSGVAFRDHAGSMVSTLLDFEGRDE